MTYKQQLLDRLSNREAKVGIVGLGYVGLPLAVEFAEAGFSVIGGVGDWRGVHMTAGAVSALCAARH